MTYKVINEIDGSISNLIYDDSFLSQEEQNELLFELENNTEFTKYPNSTRLMCWLDIYNRPYKFSKMNLNSQSFPKVFSNLKQKVNDYLIKNNISTECYDSVLINKYPSLQSGVGWHSDNELCIPKDSPIVSISIGDERDFEIKRMTEIERERETKNINEDFKPNKEWKHEMYRYKLKSGSKCVMYGSLQRFLYHQIPKYKKTENEHVRYNFTFRQYNQNFAY